MERVEHTRLIRWIFINFLIFFITFFTIGLINKLNRIADTGFWLTAATILLYLWILSKEIPIMIQETA